MIKYKYISSIEYLSNVLDYKLLIYKLNALFSLAIQEMNLLSENIP